jgi:hypothetical protein
MYTHVIDETANGEAALCGLRARWLITVFPIKIQDNSFCSTLVFREVNESQV